MAVVVILFRGVMILIDLLIGVIESFSCSIGFTCSLYYVFMINFITIVLLHASYCIGCCKVIISRVF